jgi:hypothetical protein
MLEFELKRSKKGKRSRWAKKYPRKRILKKGSEKAAGWYFHNWYDDNYHYFHGDLHKFLLQNVGRPVDKVFSEFLQRCRKGTEKYNLKEQFYDMFEEKEDIDYRGGFYLSNGIINYKKRSKRPKGSYVPSSLILSQFNTQNLPSKRKLYNICERAKETHKKQLLGTFYISTGLYKSRKATVYVAVKSDYKTSCFYMNIANIVEVGLGIRFYVQRTQDGKEYIDPKYITYYEYKWLSNKELPDYVFLTKEGD